MRKSNMNEEDRKKQLSRYQKIPPRQPWELFDHLRFKGFLSANNLTYTDISELTSLNRATIAKAGSPNQKISLDTYIAIITALGLPFGTFLKGDYVNELYKTLLKKIYVPITSSVLRSFR